MDDTEHYIHMKELEEQKNIAEKANASKSAFLSVVSHEIRTPMNAVVGMTELLLCDKNSLDSKQEKYLQNIRNSGEALVMIVNDILDQSKIEAGKMEIVDAKYELRPMIEDVRLIIENRIGSKPVQLITETDDIIPQFLMGDGLRIRQILINLMNNAVKFTEEGFVHLTIRCTGEDDGKIGEAADCDAVHAGHDREFAAPHAKALVVDDTEINLMIAEEILTSSFKLQVDTCLSGEKAVELIKLNRYDIIFMDYMMPYMDGVETTEQIRELAAEAASEGGENSVGYFSSVPIIALTGDSSDETKEKFLKAGINDFTEKPLELTKLKILLHKWLPEELRQYSIE